MNVTQHKNPGEFAPVMRDLVRVGDARSEYENVLILRILEGINAGHYSDYRLFSVHQQDAPVLAAAMTPPHNLALSQGPKEAIPPIIDYVKLKEIPFPGINGPSDLTAAFAEIWNGSSDQKLYPALTLPLYIITEIVPPRPAIGCARLATINDLDLLTQWYVDFGIEAGMHPHECVPNPDKVRRKILSDALLVWESPDGTPISFAGHASVTANGMTIGPVYTPPPYRGQGYAANLVAELSARVLAQGKWCGLFADAKNPISNKIYQRIGYQPVFEYQEYRF